MKKSIVRTLAVLLTVVLVFSALSVTAFAATTRTFFTRSAGGYSCTGKGDVNDYMGRAIFNATPNPLQPVAPPDSCGCIVWVYTYNEYGTLLGATLNNEGTTSAIAVCTTTTKVHRIECTYTFNNIDLGIYELYNY